MRIDELLTEEEKGWLSRAWDKVMGSGQKDYDEYVEYARKYMNWQPDPVIREKLRKKFPELDKREVDLNRVMSIVQNLRRDR